MVHEPSVPERYIAFLRAINVGGHTVKMEHLRRLFEEIGFSNVATFIASGNVVFETSPADPRTLEARIEAQLKQALGYEVATSLRTPEEVAGVASCRPFGDAEGSMYVGFLKSEPPAEARKKILSLRTATDDFYVDGREVYWRCLTSMHESTFSGAVLERVVGAPATLRNITSVRKLAAKHPPR